MHGPFAAMKKIEMSDQIKGSEEYLKKRKNEERFKEAVFHENDCIRVNLNDFSEDKVKIDFLQYVKRFHPEKAVKVKGILSRSNAEVGSLNYSKFIFEDEVNFRSCKFLEEVNFKHCKFNDRVNFYDSTFIKNVRFQDSDFEKTVEFTNVSFEGLADFYKVRFHSPQQFHLTDFYDRAIFSNAEFQKPVQFLYNRVDSNTFISFENAVFDELIDISRANFNCKVRFWGAKMKSYPKDYTLYHFDNYTSSKEIDKEVKANGHKKIRESFRRIKQEFSDEGNKIEAINYQVKEMNAYAKELRASKFIKKLDDIIVLFFNWISNNYGSSWFRGFVFTSILTLIVHICIIKFLYGHVVLYSDNWESSLALYIKLFNVTNWKFEHLEILNEKPDLRNLFYVILFVGRIFIGYGYYQTISAFRKFGKK